ncbi:MAG: LysR family transcriptional regulator [Oceanospirillaceae bacterium]|jgi:DNA-binding transcriptional LysR family regulator|nr:LysR family transcriptional regulator [Oceanospirillaceae bacterium]MBT4443634.1 LysR family transcriptional regulator [Oceanospirillaceae bacterium]MBT6077065.1 LysR family transcriptional regulator [Oceanospirillaceae bacterium]
MDSIALKAFLVVAEHKSFSRAAEQLYLTQPAVSKRIVKLEEQLNTRLFDRIGRTVSLTVAGQHLLPKAKAILQAMDDTAGELTNLSGRVGGQLRIATSHHISLHRLPEPLRKFIALYPQVELDIQFAESEVIYDGLLHGRWQLGIITLNPEPHPQIEQQVIWQDQMQFVAAPDHPLSQHGPVELSQLSSYPALLSKSNTFTRGIVEQDFATQGLGLKVAMSTNNLDTIRMMVSIGMGWSILPQTLINHDLKVIASQSKPIIRQLGCVWHQQRSLSNAAKALMEILQAG